MTPNQLTVSPLSYLVYLLERNTPARHTTFAECPLCGKGFGRGGGPCGQCVRGEIERRHGIALANALCDAVVAARVLSPAGDGGQR